MKPRPPSVVRRWAGSFLAGFPIVGPALASLMCAGLLLADQAAGQTNAYQVIAERNVFGLKAAPPPAALASPESEPTADLLFTGVIEFAGGRQALFMVVEPGKPPVHFNLREGQQNDWLEVKSIKVRDGTVKGILKQRVVQVRNIGTEVELTLATNGIKSRTVGDNTGHPLRGAPNP